MNNLSTSAALSNKLESIFDHRFFQYYWIAAAAAAAAAVAAVANIFDGVVRL